MFSAEFVEAATPQQKNGYDCGLYVLSISEYLGNVYTGSKQDSALSKAITPEHITSLRKTIKDKILGFKMEKEGISLFSMKKKK